MLIRYSFFSDSESLNVHRRPPHNSSWCFQTTVFFRRRVDCLTHNTMEMDSRRNEQTRYIQSESDDAIVSRLAQQDKVPWYSKPNLRALYFLMVPTCLGVEMTSGQVPYCDVCSLEKCLHEQRFDMSMVNGLQTMPSWLQCRVFAS